MTSETAAGAATRWAALGTILVAEAMDIVDTTTVNVAGPAIRRSIGGADSLVQWLSATYTLAFAVLLITGGRLGDRYGQKRMFLIGAIGFTAASLACGCAITPALLICARAVQGGFGALLLPQGIGIITRIFTEAERPKAFSVYGPVLSTAATIGPLFGGALIAWNLWGTSWRLIFFVNLVLGLAAIIGAARYFPPDHGKTVEHLDSVAASIAASVTFCIVFPLIQGPAAGWPWWSLAMLAAGFVGTGVFAYRESHSTSPLIEPTLLRRPTFLVGSAVALTFFAATAGVMLTLSLYAQDELGYRSFGAGLMLTPVAAGNIVGAMLAMRLSRSVGGRPTIQINLGIAAAALAIITVMGPHPSGFVLALPLLIAGIGFGGIVAPLFSTILAGIIPAEAGSASGALGAVQQFAGALGVAGLVTVYTMASRTIGHGLMITALATVGVLAIGGVLTLALPRANPSESERHE